MLTIKDLAGHESIETTMRYMHLASSAPRDGIRALETPARGGLVEAPPAGEENSRNLSVTPPRFELGFQP